MKTMNTPPTQQLEEQVNKPLHVQKENLEENEDNPNEEVEEKSSAYL